MCVDYLEHACRLHSKTNINKSNIINTQHNGTQQNKNKQSIHDGVPLASTHADCVKHFDYVKNKKTVSL